MAYLFLTSSSYFVTGLEIPDISQISDSLVYKSLLLQGVALFPLQEQLLVFNI